MYHSGRWHGYWQQSGLGRQPMNDLVLRFDARRVSGHGYDCVGHFRFEGTYDGRGHLTLLKRYVGGHSVLYDGDWDGEGSILGEWHISTSDQGPFALRPEDHAASSAPAIREIVPRDRS